jgi:hypothetical protein
LGVSADEGAVMLERQKHRSENVLTAAVLVSVLWCAASSAIAAEALTAQQQRSLDIYKEFVEINTVTGPTTWTAVDAMPRGPRRGLSKPTCVFGRRHARQSCGASACTGREMISSQHDVGRQPDDY